MKKLYLIYAKIPTILFDTKIHDFVSDESKYRLMNNHYIGLYAWTPNKILLDAFLNFRNGAKDMYRVVKRKLTKDEYLIFRKEHFYEELLYYRISSKNDSTEETFNIGYEPSKKDSIEDKESFFSKKDGVNQVACTRYEFTSLFESAQQYLYEYMYQIVQAEYIAFNSEYQQMLDYLGYCDVFNDIHDGYELSDDGDLFYWDRHESTQFNKSYNLTFYGNKLVDIYENRITLFINIYYEMIVGYTPGYEIKLLIYK